MGIELSDLGLEGVQKVDSRIGPDAQSCLVGTDAFPPVAGEKLFLLILSREERKTNILGDLAEEYSELAQKFGRRFATIWYYKQAAASASPFLHKIAKWGLFLSVGELVRRLTH